MRRVFRWSLGLALLLVVSGASLLPAPAAPVTITVPYSSVPVAAGDLDGNPATGAWEDALTVTIPLENGAASPYGTALLSVKHDGTNVYFKVEGSIDVPWSSSTGDHFWLGVIFSTSSSGHHQAGQDGVFFGEDAYTSGPPLLPVDTNGGGKPPSKDASQDLLGRMGVSGSAAPYAFTAEWMRKLSTGDGNDIAFLADGTTSYWFYATTDSDGGGSRGGTISHKQSVNANTIRFAVPPAPDPTPPTVSLTSPADGATVSGTVLVSADASDNPGGSGMKDVTFFIDDLAVSTDDAPPYEYSWDTTTVSNGPHTVKAEARDVAGNVASAQVTVQVDNVDRIPPTAVAGPDVVVPPGTPVTLDGSASTDNVGIVSYVWTFTDGGPVTLTGAVVTYTFLYVGDYLVTLTVADAAGNTASDTLWVHVTADMAPPVAQAGADQTVPQGSLVTLDGRASTDDVGIERYVWTFTDGTPQSLSGAVVTYRFLNLGDFLITLTVRDYVGNEATDTLWVNVTRDTVPPVADAGPDVTIDLGETVNLNGSNSTDDVYIAKYAWSLEGTSVVLEGPVVTYTPTEGGVLRFLLTVADASGNTGTDEVNVTVVAPDVVPPLAPAGLQATGSGVGAVALTWSPNGEEDLAGYLVYRLNPEGVPVLLTPEPIPTNSFVDVGLEPGATYTYVVRAVDRAGNVSPPSEGVRATAGPAPPEPFDWASVRWVAAPLFAALAFGVLAVLAIREARRPPRFPEAPPPPPPPEVGP